MASCCQPGNCISDTFEEPATVNFIGTKTKFQG